MSLIVEVPSHLSHSSADSIVGSYCPSSYFFDRVLGKPSVPGWAMIGGSALHAASEDWDHTYLRGEVIEDPSALQGMFEMAFDIEIRKTAEKTPYPQSEWHRSGRQGQQVTGFGGPNKKDADWWRARGPIMLAGWASWRLTSGWEIAEIAVPTMVAPIDGDDDPYMDYKATPGIEVPFEVDVAGIPVKGYIDRVFERNGEYLVVDLKSGMEPDSSAQLGT